MQKSIEILNIEINLLAWMKKYNWSVVLDFRVNHPWFKKLDLKKMEQSKFQHQVSLLLASLNVGIIPMPFPRNGKVLPSEEYP